MLLYTLYIGLEKTAAGETIGRDAAHASVNAIKFAAASRFGGYSAASVDGGWINEQGQLVEETALRLEVAAKDAAQVDTFAEFCGRTLHQSCVMVVSPVGEVKFVQTAAARASSAA